MIDRPVALGVAITEQTRIERTQITFSDCLR